MNHPIGCMSDAEFARRYLSGDELWGDDFSQEEVRQWYSDECEGYADLGHTRGSPGYSYHELNRRLGFRYLPEGLRFRKALGVGSAWGLEFEPIVERLDAVTILEPSEQLVGTTIGEILRPTYVKPAPTGILPFDSGSFGIVLCLGTLHHIANVGTVITEMVRVAEPGGYLLIREPIISMGDWRSSRGPELTRRERGIPYRLLLNMATDAGCQIVRENVCVCPLVPRMGKMMKVAPYNSKGFTFADGLLSQALKPLYRYHATAAWHKLRPTSVYIVARKTF